MADDATYRLRAETTLVERSDMRSIDAKVVTSVLLGRKWPEVRWTVVGLDSVSVVNFLAWESPRDHAVFVGLDVILGTELPDQYDVAMTGKLSSQRLTVRRRLSRLEITDPTLEMQLTAFRTSLPLGSRIRHLNFTDDTDDRSIGYAPVVSHEAIVFLYGQCGQHFHGLGAFDAHLERYNDGLNEKGVRSYQLRHLEGEDAKLEAWTEDGVCEMSKPTQEGVTVWRRPLSEKDRERLARMSARGQDADSG